MVTKKHAASPAPPVAKSSSEPQEASSPSRRKSALPKTYNSTPLPTGRTIRHRSPHQTSTTSWCVPNGMPIDVCADLLGHANLNSVMIYVKNSPEQIRVEYMKMGNIA